MPRVSIFDASLPLGGESQVYWRRSAPGSEFAGDLAISRPSVNPPIAPEIIDGAGPTYVRIIRLRDDAGRVLINLSADPEHDTSSPDEFTAEAERDIRLCVQFRDSRLVIAIADTADPYHFLPANAAGVLAFAAAWKADAGRSSEPVHAALAWGGAGTRVDFTDFTTTRLIALSAAGAAGPMSASATLRFHVPLAAALESSPFTGAGTPRYAIPLSADIEIGPFTAFAVLHYPLPLAATLDAGPLSGIAVLRDPRRCRRAIRASSPEDVVLTALEIRHPLVAEPVRVVNDLDDRIIGGKGYVALRFQARLADDAEGQPPQAELWIDNVGRELTQWIEAAQGGAGATVRVMRVFADERTAPEWEMTMDDAGVRVDQERVTVRLGFDPLLGRNAVKLRHDPQTSPGLF